MEIVKWVIAAFAVLGALDRLTGSHFGLGKEFTKGVTVTGTLALTMTGMICLAPVLSRWMTFLFSGVCGAVGLDLSFIGGFLPNDMGGAVMARELAVDPALGVFNGLVVSCMIGGTVCWTVPLVLGAAKKENHRDILLGLLCGIATIPVGCLVGGIMLGIPFGTLVFNMLPALFIALICCAGLKFAPDLSCRIFSVIGKAIEILILIGLTLGVIDALTGVKVFEGLASIKDAFGIIADILVILVGIFPMIALLSRLLKKPFAALGKKLGITELSVTGLITTLANSIPTLTGMDKLDRRGRVINAAFSVSAAFVIGDHLAFTAAFEPSALGAVIAAKVVSGVFSLIPAFILCRKIPRENERSISAPQRAEDEK
ncbi:MAG: ethanolamine utilization protein EutH, partial [Clostridia bacterium]|nr:ethanolamine utilization protein EutH [Clostridia bacterium]